MEKEVKYKIFHINPCNSSRVIRIQNTFYPENCQDLRRKCLRHNTRDLSLSLSLSLYKFPSNSFLAPINIYRITLEMGVETCTCRHV
jgi:hypothetical protein